VSVTGVLHDTWIAAFVLKHGQAILSNDGNFDVFEV
jgi:hypothetical protein